MHVIDDPAGLTGQNLHAFTGGVITIGNFDGVHLGHRALLAAAGAHAGPRVVVTFAPHPVQVLYPERGLKRLLPPEDLRERLPDFGINLLIELPFTREFASLAPADFLRDVLAPLAPRALVAGYDFGFGKSRGGSLASLREWCTARAAELTVVPPLEVDGAVVSSRRLRELVERGEVEAVRRLLARPFYVRGPVVRGAGRGATIGYPTLNQAAVNETLPRRGVYVTRARHAGRAFASVTNVGLTPTFGGAPAIKVETYVLDADVDWRDQVIDVDFLARLRDELKFDGVAALREQIARDVAAARAFTSRED